MNSKEKITFSCDDCETEGHVLYSELEYQTENSERGMGAHIEYWGECEVSCSNPKCSTTITIKHNYTEYPVDNFEDGELNIDGANLL